MDEDKSQWGRQQGGATAPGEGIQCVRALSTLRRAHRRTIGGMECVCEHYSCCVIARTAASLGAWNVRGRHIIPLLLRRRPIQRSNLVTLRAHHAPTPPPPVPPSSPLACRTPRPGPRVQNHPSPGPLPRARLALANRPPPNLLLKGGPEVGWGYEGLSGRGRDC